MEPTDAISPLLLFHRADWIIKAVIAILALASLLSWAVILGKIGYLRRQRRLGKAFSRMIDESEDLDDLAAAASHRSDIPSVRLFLILLAERRAIQENSPGIAAIEREERLNLRFDRIARIELAQVRNGLESWMPALATIGSTAPFVGLFGTVWGIINSFNGIAASGKASLAAVAPGISEALFATALGLLAAIPAVVGYNKLIEDNRRLIDNLATLVDRLRVRLSPLAETTSSRFGRG